MTWTSNEQLIAFLHALDHLCQQLTHINIYHHTRSPIRSSLKTESAAKELFQHVWSKKFPLLRSFSFDTTFIRIISEMPTKPIPSIRSLTLALNDMNDFGHIINFCPNMKYIKVSFVSEDTSTDFNLLPQSILTFLDVTFELDGYLVDRMDDLLLLTPNLQCLIVKSSSKEYSQIDFNRLAQVLTQRVPLLQRFSCNIQLSLRVPGTPISDIKYIRNLNPFFHKMKVTFDWIQGLVLKT